MRPEDELPSIRRIATSRSDAFAFEISGHITSADVENMYGLLEAAYEDHDKIDLLVRFTDYDGFDWDVVLKDTTLALETRSLKHVRKCAMIGAPAWMNAAMAVVTPFLAMRVGNFASDKEAEAWTWLGAEAQEES